MVQGLDESLKRMKLDYVDILYVHAWDARTPVEETMRYTDGHSLTSTADLMR
jgi:aryl-alcohol dehydrogenase-like predicted oxidoreductase